MWTREPPTESGFYWHCDGNGNRRVVEVMGTWHFTGQEREYELTVGQTDILVGDLGGWWGPMIPCPPLP